MTEQNIEQLARRRAGAKLGFYIHALTFVLVMSGLAALNYLTSPKPWSLAPLLGWGFGLTIHGFTVFGRDRLSGFKERLVQAELEKLKKSN
ncbi:2TM domain-containing protein [Neisseriaceae bacterium JH1-16]|nr:2TM domain-containing protein [Neisseriaceae bacterium JH1-16]